MLPGIKLFDLTDRVSIVTGGSKGLGAAIAAGLASAGSNLVLVSRNLEELESVAKELERDYSVTVLSCEGDVTDQEQVERIVSEVISRFGRIDVLVNNAGINILSLIHI